MFLPECPFYVGIDWAAETHAVCVLDGTGKITAEFTIAHTAEGFIELLRRLGGLRHDRVQVPVGIERPDGRLVDALLEAGHAVLALVKVLTALGEARRDLDRSVVAHLGEHPDEKIFTSLPRSGQINAAQVLAEWGDSRAAYDGPDAVAALCGMCPVTNQSGKHRAVHFRWACNKRFRTAISIFADNSRHTSPWAAKVYTDALARGHDHPHAVRVLARAWIRVIYRCWIDGIPYHPARHRNAVELAGEQTA